VVAAGTQWRILELDGGNRNTVMTSGRLVPAETQCWLQKKNNGSSRNIVMAAEKLTVGCRNTALSAGTPWWLQEHSYGCRNTLMAKGT
jgi:hypothetical protein